MVNENAPRPFGSIAAYQREFGICRWVDHVPGPGPGVPFCVGQIVERFVRAFGQDAVCQRAGKLITQIILGRSKFGCGDFPVRSFYLHDFIIRKGDDQPEKNRNKGAEKQWAVYPLECRPSSD